MAARRAGSQFLRPGWPDDADCASGAVAASTDDMRESIRGLLESDVYRENIGQRAHDFATREFTSAAASRYIELIDEARPVRAGIRAADGGTIQ